MKIVVTGGSGFIGTKLVEALLRRGSEVVVLDIKEPQITHPKLSFFYCNLITDPIPQVTLERAHGVIHLAGYPILGRWNKKLKHKIYESRIVSTRRLVDVFHTLKTKPETFVCASAVGYYGDTGDELINETHIHGHDFLATVCALWENEAINAEASGIRTVRIRTALVLGKGGMLRLASQPFKFYVGGWFGDGSQWFPWIHWEDLVNIYVQAVLDDRMSGPYNAVAPELTTQKIFMTTLGKVLRSPAWLPVPIFLLRACIGSAADIFSTSQKIDGTKISQTGFVFIFPDVASALAQALKK